MTTTVSVRPTASTRAWGSRSEWVDNASTQLYAEKSSDGSYGSPNDATYIANASGFGALGVYMAAPSIPAGAQIVGVSFRVRAKATGSPTGLLVLYHALGTNTDTSSPYVCNLTSSFSWFETPVHALSPLGVPWSFSMLALSLKLQPYAYVGVQVSEIIADVQYVSQPAVSIAAPSGTVTTSRPLVQWAWTQADGQLEDYFQVRIFDNATFTGGGFDPATSVPILDSGVQLAGGGGLDWTPTSDLFPASYGVAVRAGTAAGGSTVWSAWDTAAFTVSVNEPVTPSVAAVGDATTGIVTLTLSGLNNLLSEVDADFEASTGSWTGFGGNCSLAQVTSPAPPTGTKAMSMTATAGGDMTAFHVDPVPVVAGLQYVARVSARTAVTARTTKVQIQWLDSSLAELSRSTGSNVTDASGSWKTVSCAATAPANAVAARVVFVVVSAAGSEVHYIDSACIRRGVSTTWFRGGLANLNRLSANQASIETDTSGFDAVQNVTLARSNAQAATGTYSLSMTAGTATPMAARTSGGVNGIPVIPGAIYSARASVRGATRTKDATLDIEWWDADGNSLGKGVNASPVTDSTSAWTTVSVLYETAPADAAYASILIQFATANAGDVHYVDQLMFAEATTLPWWVNGEPARWISTALVETSDDGGLTWQVLRQGAYAAWRNDALTLVDYEARPNVQRSYRVRTVAFDGTSWLVSNVSTPALVTLDTNDQWWLKTTAEPYLAVPLSEVTAHTERLTERSGTFAPLAADGQTAYPIVVTNGLSGIDGQLDVEVLAAQWDDLLTVLRRTDPLYLVSPFDEWAYIRVTDRSWEKRTAIGVGPLRPVSIPYIEVDQP